MPVPQPHRALQALLFVIALLLLAGGLVALFASGYIVDWQPWLESIQPGSITILLKVAGAMALAFSYLSYAASRDPVRYVAFVDALAFLLVAVSSIDLYGLWHWHIAPFHPAGWVIVRVVIRLAVALVLVARRPRGVDA